MSQNKTFSSLTRHELKAFSLLRILFILDPIVVVYLIFSEGEEEDFSKGAEDFVEAAKKRRTERQSDNGNDSQLSRGGGA